MVLYLGGSLGQEEFVFKPSGHLHLPDSFSCSPTELQSLLPDSEKTVSGCMAGYGILEAHRVFFWICCASPISLRTM